MSVPERSPERDEALKAILDLVPEHGWSVSSLRRALPPPDLLELLFPGGTADMIEAHADLADREMLAEAAAADMTGLGLTARVRAVFALRLARQRPHREAIRRALAVLALPQHNALSARILARTTDSIWFAAGDRSADVSWYTKRAILAAIYATTLLYWLRDYGENDTDTLAFLDRRLASSARIGRARARLTGWILRMRPKETSTI